jgi:hypothetical protein
MVSSFNVDNKCIDIEGVAMTTEQLQSITRGTPSILNEERTHFFMSS